MRGTVRTWIVGITAAATLSLATLNITGVVPLPMGPLGGQQPAARDVAWSTMPFSPSPSPLYLVPFVTNGGPFSATIAAVIPRGVSVPGSVEVLGSLPFDREDPAQIRADGTHGVILGIEREPGPAWADPDPVAGAALEPTETGLTGRAFLVRFTPDPRRETVVLRFDVEYTVGPFHFLTTADSALGTTLIACGPDRPVVDDGCKSP